jgi:hypothetical protein
MEFEAGSLPCLQEPATYPYPKADDPIAFHFLLSLRYVLILSSHVRLGLQSGQFPPGFVTKIPVHIFSPYVPHALPISSSLICLS